MDSITWFLILPDMYCFVSLGKEVIKSETRFEEYPHTVIFEGY